MKRSPGLEVLLESGVSSAAWISVPAPTSSITAALAAGEFCVGFAACPVLPCGTSAGDVCVVGDVVPLFVFGTVGFEDCGAAAGLLFVPGGFWATAHCHSHQQEEYERGCPAHKVNVLHVVTPQVRSCQSIAGWPESALFFAESSISVKETLDAVTRYNVSWSIESVLILPLQEFPN